MKTGANTIRLNVRAFAKFNIALSLVSFFTIFHYVFLNNRKRGLSVYVGKNLQLMR